ncbi:MAG: hypothetical protein AAB914_04380, partial [Patescibacteria group bacterium]
GGCKTLVNKPYVRFYGQDVFAGGNFPNGTRVPGGISTNHRTPAIGSGVEYAAFALGTISGFSSSDLRSDGFFDQLNFASSPKGLFGGDHIATDYFANKPDNAEVLTSNSVDLSSIANKKSFYRNTGGGTDVLTISNSSPGNSFTGSKTIYVDGDVYISENIRYADWGTDINAIPSFRLIVKGNIYIAPDVTQIDGLLVAQPNGGTKGMISTCANANGDNANPAELTTTATGVRSGTDGDCSSQLVINGAIVAQRVKWLRTFKTLSDATSSGREAYNSSNAAEVINTSPDFYLGVPADPPSGGGTSGKYDSYQALPPIL